MTDPLSRYVAQRREGQGGGPFGFSLVAEEAAPYLNKIGVPIVEKRAILLNSLPQPVLQNLNDALPAADKLGPEFDYKRLSELAEQHSDKLPPAVYNKMASVALIGLSRQNASSFRAGVAGTRVASGEALRQTTFGLFQPPEIQEGDLDAQGVAIAKAIGSIAGIAGAGHLVYSGLSKITLLPKIGPLLLQIPQRVREITLGIGTGAILDAARPDGLPQDPAAIDIPARIASPLAKLLGDSETAQRASLFVGGAVTGGIITKVLGGVFRGIQAGREAVTALRMTPDELKELTTRLNAAGIGVETGATKQAVVAKWFRNIDKVAQTEKLATMRAADETRTDFIMQHLYSDPAFSGPPKLPNTRVVDAQGQPLRVFRGHYGTGPERDIQFFAEDPTHAGAYTQPLGPPPEGARITPAYLDIKNPLDLTNGNVQPPAKFLDEYEKIAGVREVYSGDVIGSEADVVEAARKSGYDGIKYSVPPAYIPPRTGAREVNLTSWVALNPSKQVIPAFVSDDAKLMAAVFRANPGGLSIAKGVTNLRAADEVVKRLGLNVTAIRAGEDYLIMKPQVTYPIRPVSAKLANQMADFAEYVKASNKGKPTTKLGILPNGTVVRGDYTTAEMVSRYKIKAPMVQGGPQNDVAFREHFGIVDVQVAEGGKLKVNLPSTVNQRQVDILGRMADRGPAEMTINAAKPGLTKTIANPFGMQVQDAMADMVQGATRPKISAETMSKVEQYKRTGVFKGQAAHLMDGYPVEVQSRYVKTKGQAMIVYKDPLTGSTHRIGEDNIAILPTSLEGEFAPSLAFMEAMDPAERTAFATLRRGLNEGLAQPIKTFHDLEGFASTRGKFATSLGQGRVRLYDPNTGEGQVYDDFKAATRAIKGSVGPLPDLTPPEIEEILGFKPNFGSVGGNGPPPRFGEPIAITADEFDKAITTQTLDKLVPGALELALKPSIPLFKDFERRYGLPFGRVAMNLQDAIVHRINFTGAWMYGKGPGLPEGVMSLDGIFKLAGKPGDDRQRLMMALAESMTTDPGKASAISTQLSANEIKAVQEARKWMGTNPGDTKGLFNVFGIEAEFVPDYVAHFRANADKFGNDPAQIWRMTKNTPLPKAIPFLSDYARDGSLNLYEDRLFVAMSQYLNAGARSRFMNAAMDDAKKLLRAIPDQSLKVPLSNYLEALRGSEFTPQRAALDASFTRMMQTLGASEKISKDIGEKLTSALLGTIYSATMAFRPGLAVRNATQIFQTLWPLVGRFDDSFAEGIGRAMTLEGRDQAYRAGAISIKPNAAVLGEDMSGMVPKAILPLYELGFKWYDGADTFTRAVSFHVAKLQSQRAIEEFAGALKKGENLAEAQRTLIKRSGAMVLDAPIVKDYMRRIATSPENASDFLGKNIADVTQFLYGKGMQGRWMRSVPGRFLGQFGTWPLWYIDYVTRSFKNMWRQGYNKEALAFIGKIALVDMAIYEGGKSVGLDLRKWMSGNSMFYTGGPAIELVNGVRELWRGAGEDYLGTYESPATKQRIASAVQVLQRTGQAFIPNMNMFRDINNLINARTPTEQIAALLAVKPSTEYTVQQRLELLFNPGRLSTDIDLEHTDPDTQTATELLLKGMSISNRDRTRLPLPLTGEPLPTQPQGFEAQPGGMRGLKITTPARPGVQGRPPLEPTALPESIRTGESKPTP